MKNRVEVVSQSHHAKAGTRGLFPRFISQFLNIGLRYDRAVAEMTLNGNNVQVERRGMAPLRPGQPNFSGNPQGLILRSPDGSTVSRIGLQGGGGAGHVDIHPHTDSQTHPVGITFEAGRIVVDARNRKGAVDIIPSRARGELIIHI